MRNLGMRSGRLSALSIIVHSPRAILKSPFQRGTAMNRKRVLGLALALLMSIPMTALAQTDVTGDWVVTIDTPQGAQSIDLVMKQAGEALTGTIVSPMGSVEFKGKIVKDAIEVTYNMDLQGNAITIAMTGAVAGDKISGNLNFGGLGDVPWTAARKGAASASVAKATPAA